MNYKFSVSNGSDSRLYNHTGDTIHAFTHDGRGFRTRTDEATSRSVAMYVVLTYCATEASRKNGSSNSTIKGLHSVYRGSYIFLLTNSMNYKFSLSNGSDSRLYNHTGDIIHAFTNDGRGFRTRRDAATSPSIDMHVGY